MATAVLTVLLCGAALALDIDVRGTVADAAGGPLAGASVSLLARTLSTTTDSDGYFEIMWSSPVMPRASGRAGRGQVFLDGGLVRVENARAGVLLEVSAHDLCGRLVSRVRQRLDGDRHSVIRLQDHSCLGRACVVSVSLDGTVALTELTTGHGGHGGLSGTASSPNMHAWIAKSQAAADSLAVTLPGYLSRVVAIESYDDSVHVALMSATTMSFSINHDVSLVVTPACSLFITDPSGIVSRVRFTQVGGDTPDFDADDPLNAVRSLTRSGEESSLPWMLPQGDGTKQVYAEVAFADTARGRDTLLTRVSIAPWQASVGFTGEGVTKNDSCPYASLPCIERYVLPSLTVEATLNLSGDTTFEDTFKYWMIFPDTSTVLDTVQCRDGNGCRWLATVPRTGVLASASRDSTMVLTYGLDPATPDGAENLSCLTAYEEPRGYPYVQPTDQACVSADENLTTIIECPLMIRAGQQLDGLSLSGVESAVCFMFRGRFFGEDRFVTNRLDIQYADRRTAIETAFLRVHPPFSEVLLWDENQYRVYHRDTAGGVFEAALTDIDTARPLVDPRVVVARIPDGANMMYWRDWLTLDTLCAATHEVFPVSAAPNAANQTDNRITIDTRYWPSAWYCFATVCGTEIGHEALASWPTWVYVEGVGE